MRLKFTGLLILIVLSSCKGQIDNKNNKKMEDQLLYSFDTNQMSFLVDIYDYSYEKLEKCRKNVSKQTFQEKVKEIYNIDFDEIKYNDIYVNEASEHSDEILVNQRMIFINELPNIESKNEITESYLELLCNYNDMIFSNDIKSTNFIKANNPNLLIDLIRIYGYSANKDWLKFAFNKSKLYEPMVLEKFLFSVKCKGTWRAENGDCHPIYTLRKDMLDKMIEYGAELSQLSTVANMVSNGRPESYEEDTEELYAYLMAYCYKAGQSGIIEYLYDTHPKMIEVFRKKDFYGIEDLEDFTDNFYKPQNKRFGLSSIGPDPYIAYGVINDPDGYTNLRDGKGTSAKVIKKIKEGEKFGIETNTGEWWIVVTEDGTRGRIHSNRITIIKE